MAIFDGTDLRWEATDLPRVLPSPYVKENTVMMASGEMFSDDLFRIFVPDTATPEQLKLWNERF